MKWPKTIPVANYINNGGPEFKDDGSPCNLLGWFAHAFGYTEKNLRDFILAPIDEDYLLLCLAVNAANKSVCQAGKDPQRKAEVYNLTFYLLGYTDGNDIDPMTLSHAHHFYTPSISKEISSCL